MRLKDLSRSQESESKQGLSWDKPGAVDAPSWTPPPTDARGAPAARVIQDAYASLAAHYDATFDPRARDAMRAAVCSADAIEAGDAVDGQYELYLGAVDRKDGMGKLKAMQNIKAALAWWRSLIVQAGRKAVEGTLEEEVSV